jgi:hypothetical protein
VFYLDSSAAAKLVIVESGSDALREWMNSIDAAIVSSDLLRTELLRAIRRHVPEQIAQGQAVLDSITMFALSRNVYETATTLGPPLLRSLDAIHLAAAMEVGGDELEAIITYDARMIDAARAMDIAVVSPR